MLHNTFITYGKLSRWLHWGMAIMLISMLLIGYYMQDFPSPGKYKFYKLHKSTGLLLFGLTLFRFWWRQKNPIPLLPDNLPKWQKSAAHINIILFYILMFLMPITGFLMSSLGGFAVDFYNIITIPPLAENKTIAMYFRQAHGILFYIFSFLICLHVSAALYHHFIRKDNILRRMLTAKI